MTRTNFLKHVCCGAVVAAACSAVTLFPTSARAQTTLISNLGQTLAGYTTFNTASDRYAQEFTASNTTASLLSATLVLNQQLSSGTTDTVHLYIYSSTTYLVNGVHFSGGPDYMPSTSLIGDLGTATVSGTTAAQYTFSSASAVSLTGSQPYWLVAMDNNSNVGWGYTTSTTTTGTGATVNTNSTTAASPDAGANWSVAGNTQGLQFFSLFLPAAMNTPEPGSLSLLLLGIGGTVLASRRRFTRDAIKSSDSRGIARK